VRGGFKPSLYPNNILGGFKIMPILKQYQLFISHSWKNNEYDNLIKLLDDAKFFYSLNYSVEKSEPLPVKTSLGLYNGLKNKIAHSNIVLIIAGMYVNYSDAIQDEIEIARAYNKPIIAIAPWGHTNIPIIVQQVAKEIVGWNRDSIVRAIRTYAN